MRRMVWFLLTLGAFFIVMAMGVYTSHQQFNRMVLPTEPVQLLEITQQPDRRWEIELLGEKLAVDAGALQEQAQPYLQLAQQQWVEVQSHPEVQAKIHRIKSVIQEKWETWSQSEQIKAVNQWVQEQI